MNSRITGFTSQPLLTLISRYRELTGIYESRDFDLQMKYNLPSWCDRVLWKSYPLVHVVCQSYGEEQFGRFGCPELMGCSLSVCKMGEVPVTPDR